jgi:hypothetical protein
MLMNTMLTSRQFVALHTAARRRLGGLGLKVLQADVACPGCREQALTVTRGRLCVNQACPVVWV